MKEKAVKKVATKETPKPKEQYHLEIRVNDVDFKTKASTLEEAIQSFIDSPEYPLGAKTTAVIKVKFGKKETVRTLPVVQARRTFLSMQSKDTVMEILSAQLKEALSE